MIAKGPPHQQIISYNQTNPQCGVGELNMPIAAAVSYLLLTEGPRKMDHEQEQHNGQDDQHADGCRGHHRGHEGEIRGEQALGLLGCRGSFTKEGPEGSEPLVCLVVGAPSRDPGGAIPWSAWLSGPLNEGETGKKRALGLLGCRCSFTKGGPGESEPLVCFKPGGSEPLVCLVFGSFQRGDRKRVSPWSASFSALSKGGTGKERALGLLPFRLLLCSFNAPSCFFPLLPQLLPYGPFLGSCPLNLPLPQLQDIHLPPTCPSSLLLPAVPTPRPMPNKPQRYPSVPQRTQQAKKAPNNGRISWHGQVKGYFDSLEKVNEQPLFWDQSPMQEC